MRDLHKGLIPYRPNEQDILVGTIYRARKATELPAGFGPGELTWGGLGNFERGDCFEAAQAHIVMAQADEAGRHPKFADASVLDSYAEYLGVEKLSEQNDLGTEPTKGSKFCRKVGIADARGHKHRIGAFAFEREPDYQKLLSLIYDFGGVNLCFTLPQSAEDAFRKGEAEGFKTPVVWDYVSGSPDVGGHSTAGVARNPESGEIELISWGVPVRVTEGFVEKKLQVAIASLSHSQLTAEGTAAVSGLDWSALEQALAALRG